jgi:hypothetical protein
VTLKFGATELRGPGQSKMIVNVMTKYANFRQRGAPFAAPARNSAASAQMFAQMRRLATLCRSRAGPKQKRSWQRPVLLPLPV